MVSLEITVGGKIWYVFGAYVPPNYQMTVQQMDQALELYPEWKYMILSGDINACLAQPRDCNKDDL